MLDDKITTLTDDGASRLIEAIVRQAVNDYKNSLYKYNTIRDKKKRKEHKNMIGNCELFFTKNIDTYCDLDGIKIMNKIREDVKKDLAFKGIKMRIPR